MLRPLAWTVFCLNCTVYAACPFFRRTRKGLLTLQWSLLNAITSDSLVGVKSTEDLEARDVFLAAATLALLLENRCEISKPTGWVGYSPRMPSSCFVGNLLSNAQAGRCVVLLLLYNLSLWLLLQQVGELLHLTLLCGLGALLLWDLLVPRKTFDQMDYQVKISRKAGLNEPTSRTWRKCSSRVFSSMTPVRLTASAASAC